VFNRPETVSAANYLVVWAACARAQAAKDHSCGRRFQKRAAIPRHDAVISAGAYAGPEELAAGCRDPAEGRSTVVVPLARSDFEFNIAIALPSPRHAQKKTSKIFHRLERNSTGNATSQ